MPLNYSNAPRTLEKRSKIALKIAAAPLALAENLYRGQRVITKRSSLMDLLHDRSNSKAYGDFHLYNYNHLSQEA